MALVSVMEMYHKAGEHRGLSAHIAEQRRLLLMRQFTSMAGSYGIVLHIAIYRAALNHDT